MSIYKIKSKIRFVINVMTSLALAFYRVLLTLQNKHFNKNYIIQYYTKLIPIKKKKVYMIYPISYENMRNHDLHIRSAQ